MEDFMGVETVEKLKSGRMLASSSVKVWKFPEVGKTYILAADPSTGEGSNSAIEVIDAKTGEQCVEFAQAATPEDLAPIVLNLARMYNNAEVAIETNNVGLITNRIVMAQYENIYRFKRLDRITHSMIDVYGWWTDTKSRARMVKVFQENILEHLELIHSVQLFDDLLSFFGDATGSDDLLCAMMIAQTVRAERLLAVVD